MSVLSWLMIIFLLFLGIPGNVLNASVFYTQGLGERINLCLFALALADLINVIVMLLIYGESQVREYFAPHAWLTIPYFVGASGVEWASQLLSAVIASERCFCVVSPFHAKRLLKTSTMAAIIVVCCVVLVGGMCAIAGPKHVVETEFDRSTNTSRSFITVTRYYLDNKKIIDVFDIIIYSTALPITFFVLIVIATSIIGLKLHAAVRQRKLMTGVASRTDRTGHAGTGTGHAATGHAGTGTGHAGTGMSSKEVAVTRMLIGTSILFVICLTPNVIVQIVSFIIPDLNSTSRYFTLNMTLWYFIGACRAIRSSINFCVYYVMGSKFKECIHNFCGCIGAISYEKSLINDTTSVTRQTNPL